MKKYGAKIVLLLEVLVIFTLHVIKSQNSSAQAGEMAVSKTVQISNNMPLSASISTIQRPIR
jgi:hypothetical protein